MQLKSRDYDTTNQNNHNDSKYPVIGAPTMITYFLYFTQGT